MPSGAAKMASIISPFLLGSVEDAGRGRFAIHSLRNQESGERPVRFGVVDFRSANIW